MVLSALLQRSSLSTADTEGPELSPSITLRPAGPVNVQWHARTARTALEAAG